MSSLRQWAAVTTCLSVTRVAPHKYSTFPLVASLSQHNSSVQQKSTEKVYKSPVTKRGQPGPGVG